MERIDFHGGFFTVPSKPQDKKNASRATGAHKGFFSLLETESKEAGDGSPVSRAAEDVRVDLEQVLDEVHGLGEKLKEDPTLRTVGEYKKAVRRFLRIVVEGCYRVEERTGAKDILRQKKFTQIRIVDEKLERLAAGVMSAQRDQLEILGRVDEINGALVDLFQ